MFPHDALKSASSSSTQREPARSHARYGSYAAGNEHKYSLPPYWLLIRRRKELVFAGAVLGAAVAFALLLMSDPVYQATTSLELQGLNESFMGMSTVDPLAGTGEYAASPTTLNTQIRVIESASIRRRVSDRLGREVKAEPVRSEGILATLRTRLRGSIDPAAATRNALAIAAGSVRARVAWNTRIISISAESTLPDIAAAFANGVAAEYTAQSSMQRVENSRRVSRWLDTQIAETRFKLDQAESKLHGSSHESGVSDATPEDESLLNSNRRELQASLSGVQAERLRAQAQYELAKTTPADQLANFAQDPTLRDSETKLEDLKQQKDQLLVTLMPAHYKVRKVQQQIDDLTAAIENQRQSIVERSRTEYEAALKREQVLTQAWQAQSAAASAQSEKARSHEVLSRQAEIYRQTLGMLLQQANQAAVVSAVPANNVRVIDAAAAPSIAAKPNAIAYEIYGVLGGILASIGLAALFEAISKWRRNATFGTPGYSSHLLNVPELGVIPSIAVQKRLEAPGRIKWIPLPHKSSNDDSEMVISTGQPSLVAESFRLTLTSLVLMSRRGMHPKVIVVTSPGAGEGKTTVVSNMAIATAESGRRVLVIDADLRKSRIHSIFGLENSTGFSDAAGSGRGAALARPLISESDVAGVFVMTAGTIEAEKVSQTFHALEMPGLLNKLASQFDLILIDTPPMLQFSDARLMARYADGVILVVRSGKTDRESALAARGQLEQDHIAVIGTILNDWDAKGAEGTSLHSYYTSYLQYQKAAGAAR